MTKPIAFENMFCGGDLKYRTHRNYDRLEDTLYQPEHVFKDKDYDWPADNEGRTILALVLLAQATHRQPQYLEAILERLPEYENERGYFGPIYEDGVFDEQQFSGHSWMLRGLCEYVEWKRDTKALSRVNQIVNHLLLPARGYYRTYPAKPEQRLKEGAHAGNRTGYRIGDWYPSTDIGCAYMPLDGASHAYELLRKPELRELLCEMIETFFQLDFKGISVQTHATLSGLRGVLRYVWLHPDEAWLAEAERVYSLYIREGITENYANYNWFNRPDWTEPCAIVDSFMVAVQLWQQTGKSAYLDDAHHIFYNGLGHGQRHNGGFGCDCCAGAHDQLLQPTSGAYEAHWCCTMRGGEGLARAVQYSYFIGENDVFLPFYNSGTAKVVLPEGTIVLNQDTAYPVQGYICLQVVESTIKEGAAFHLFIPDWVDVRTVKLIVNGEEADNRVVNGWVTVERFGAAGDALTLKFPIGVRTVGTINVNHAKATTFRHGPLLLGTEDVNARLAEETAAEWIPLGGARYRTAAGITFGPINDLIYMVPEAAQSAKRRILFD